MLRTIAAAMAPTGGFGSGWHSCSSSMPSTWIGHFGIISHYSDVVVPANAGTHNPGHLLLKEAVEQCA